jgi:hypothetical protein
MFTKLITVAADLLRIIYTNLLTSKSILPKYDEQNTDKSDIPKSKRGLRDIVTN